MTQKMSVPKPYTKQYDNCKHLNIYSLLWLFRCIDVVANILINFTLPIAFVNPLHLPSNAFNDLLCHKFGSKTMSDRKIPVHFDASHKNETFLKSLNIVAWSVWFGMTCISLTRYISQAISSVFKVLHHVTERSYFSSTSLFAKYSFENAFAIFKW